MRSQKSFSMRRCERMRCCRNTPLKLSFSVHETAWTPTEQTTSVDLLRGQSDSLAFGGHLGVDPAFGPGGECARDRSPLEDRPDCSSWMGCNVVRSVIW